MSTMTTDAAVSGLDLVRAPRGKSESRQPT